MIKIYATQVMNGVRTLEMVPARYRADVEAYINELERKATNG